MSAKSAKLARAVTKDALAELERQRQEGAAAQRAAEEALLASLPAARYEVILVGSEAPLYLPMSEAQQADPAHFVKMAFANGLTCQEPHVPPDVTEAIIHFPPWRIHAIRVVGGTRYARPSIIV